MDAHPEQHAPPDADEFHAAIEEKSAYWMAACQRITQSPALAEDALQEGLLQAWAKRHQFAGNASLTTWIHRIIVNAALQILRTRKRYVWGDPGLDLLDSEPLPEKQAETSDYLANLDTLLKQLSSAEHTTFVLRHFEQWRLKEIAEVMQTNEGRVKQALFRAVRKLRSNEKYLRSL